MNTSQTIEKMTEMRLLGMKQAYDLFLSSIGSGKITNDEFIANLIETEYLDRENRKTTRLLKSAKFRYKASIEEIDFTGGRNCIFRFKLPTSAVSKSPGIPGKVPGMKKLRH